MNYSKILPFDLSNGEGIRVSLFVSGCKFHCPDCFNQEAQSFDYGKPYTNITQNKIIELVSHPYVAGLSILGGDPLWQDWVSMKELEHLALIVHRMLHKTVWLWSGFTWEQIMNEFPSKALGTYTEEQKVLAHRASLVDECDVFIDGRYEKDLKNLTLKWRGSSNQRIIDVKKSIATKQVILYGENN